MSNSETWYIVKQENGQCTILPASQVNRDLEGNIIALQHWGPYASQAEAIARRIGLIRAGKCQPA